MIKSALLIFVISALLLATFPSFAEVKEEAESYSASFFNKYSPQTALDMVLTVPGFRLSTEKDLRGFGATAGNVLIDGKRPSSKTAGIEDALKRIPASKVERIVIIRGGANLSQTSGQGVIANVIQKEMVSTGRWLAKLRKHSINNKLSPEVEVNRSVNTSGWDSSVKLNIFQYNYGRETKGDIEDVQNNTGTRQNEKQSIQMTDAFVSANSSKSFLVGDLNVAGQLGSSKYSPTTHRDNARELTPEIQSYYNRRISEFFTGEFGLDWEQPIANNWKWKVISLTAWQNWWVNAESTNYSNVQGFLNADSYRFKENKEERLIRTFFSNKTTKDLALEMGAELTYNRLASNLLLVQLDSQNNIIDVLRTNYSHVTEDRLESFINASWSLDPFIIKFGINNEISKIQVNGDASGTEQLNYLKPYLGITYNVNNNAQLRLNFNKEVGQLDFSDFAASVDLLNDRDFSSTAKLKPDQKERFSIAFDQKFESDSILSLEAFYENRSDVLEQVELEDNQQTLGNAGSAHVYGASVLYSTPLDFLGVKASLLDIEYNFISSNYYDSIINRYRELNSSSSPELNIKFRQDLGDLAWGWHYVKGVSSEYYFVNESETIRKQDTGSIFIESSFDSDYLLKLEVSNIESKSQVRGRQIYNGNRAGSIRSTQYLDDNNGYYIGFSISSTF